MNYISIKLLEDKRWGVEPEKGSQDPSPRERHQVTEPTQHDP